MNTSYRRVHLFRKADGSCQTINGIPYEADLDTCLTLAHGSAYGTHLDTSIKELWKPLLAERRMMLAIVEDKEEEDVSKEKSAISARPVGFRFICFVTDDFVKQARAKLENDRLEPPLARFLFQCHQSGKSPILTREAIAHANAYQSLNMFTFTAHDPQVFASTDRLRGFVSILVASLIESYRGYMVNSCLFEGYTQAAKGDAERYGFKILSEFEAYYRANAHITLDKRMFACYLHHANLLPASVPEIATQHRQPLLDLTPLHRETLELMLEGANDRILEEHYGSKEGAIRNRFGEMFKRIRNKPPQELMGKLDRDKLLRYVDKHIEEARPYKTMEIDP